MKQSLNLKSLIITICMLVTLVQPLALPAYADTVKWVTYKNDDFSNANQVALFSLNGSAKVTTDNTSRKVLRLTESAGNLYGTTFNKKLISAGNHYSFSTFFKFRLNQTKNASPADGITFTIQAQSNNAGSVGEGIGYGGIKPSFAVKYDTYKNASPINDPSNNYIGLATNGNVNNTNPNWYTTNLNGITLSDGNDHYSWIDYDGITKVVKVYLSNTTTRPATPVLTTSGIDLDNIFTGKSGVYAGFTAATGGSMETHDIISWYFINDYDPIDTANYTYKQAPTSISIKTTPTGQPGQHQVTATALDADGNPVEGAPLNFSSTQGDLSGPSQIADSHGQATTLWDFGTNPPSGDITAVTVGGTYTTIAIPSAPINLAAGTTAATADKLTWNTVTGATYYNLYKDGKLFASNITTPTYQVTGLTPGEFSAFTVTAVNSSESGIVESGPSNQVTLPLPLDLSIDSTGYTLAAGSTHQTVVSSVYSDGTTLIVTDYSGYSSTNPQVATISPSGVVTALGAGTTVVNAVYNGQTVQANVTVTIGAPTGVTAQQVTSTGATVKWDSVPGAHTYEIYDNGKLIASGIVGTNYEVIGLLPGTGHSFTIKAVSNGIKSPASEVVKVQTTTLRDLQINPAHITLLTGDIHTPTVNAIHLDESVNNVTKTATYTSSNPAVATVDAEGRVTAISQGTAVITASYDGKTVTETVIVQNQKLPYTLELNVSPQGVIGDGSQSVTVNAKAVKADGTPVAGVPVQFTLGSGVVLSGVTNEQGIAVVSYTPHPLQSIIPVHDTITATVTDPDSGLMTSQSAGIDYYPASVKGVVTDQVTGQPVAGATVHVNADFDGDGIIDFSSTVTTGADGSYQIPVPRGSFVYNLKIQTPVQIGDRTVTLTQTQSAPVGVLQTAGEVIESTNKLSGYLFIAAAANQSSPPIVGSLFGDGQAYAIVKGLDGNNFEAKLALGADGSFELEQVPQGKYKVSYQLKASDGTLLASPSVIVNVDKDGQLGVVYSLIDPYGTVTDAVTGNKLDGVKVQLFWADTDLNKQLGRKPNTLVTLPELPDFAPNRNLNPQLTDTAGEYAWMVFPEGDYYIVATKDGYTSYSTLDTQPTIPAANGSDSYIQNGILHVGQDLLAFNFSMQPLSKSGSSNTNSGSSYTPIASDLVLNLSIDKQQVKEGEQSTITVDYKNQSTATLGNATVTITLPEGAELVNAYGGTVDGRTVTWTIGTLPAGGSGNFKVDVKWGNLKETTTQQEILGKIALASNSSVSASSSVQVQVFSDRFGLLKHQRYILGYPDGNFQPNHTLSRAELAAIVARLTDNDTMDKAASFTDVRSAHWASGYINIATAQGYFSGYKDNTFRPEAPVTRGELVSVLARFLKLDITAPVNKHFTDINGHWSAGAVEALYRSNLLSGYPDGTFKPQDVITRVEAVTLINRTLYRGPLTGLAPLFPDVSENHWGFGDVQEATISHQSERNKDGAEIWKSTLEDNVK